MRGRGLRAVDARRVLAAAACLLVAAGCGKGVGPVVTVEGKVLMDGAPLSNASVTYFPDASRGNQAKVMVTGQTDADGEYRLATEDATGTRAKGTLLGWYKVVVETRSFEKPDNGKNVHVNKKYTSVATTDLSVEVVKKPAENQYTLQVTR